MTPARRSRARAAGGPRSRQLGGELVAGRQAVRHLLLGRRRQVRDVWLAEGADDAPILAEIVRLASEAKVPIRHVGRARIDAESGIDAPQGVLAHALPLPEADLDDLTTRGPGGRRPFLIALDGVTDPHNLGAVLRTGVLAGVTGAVLPRHRSALVTPTVAKAAAGAVEHLPIAVVPGLPSALAALKQQGVWSVGLDGDAETSVFALEVATEPLVLVVGAEGKGLGRLTAQRCDLLAAIPTGGALESLNVAAAAAVACFEVARRRGL